MNVRSKPFDLFITAALVVGGFACLLLVDFGRFTTFATALLLFGVPTVYLLISAPRNAKKTLIAGLLIGLLFGFPFDFVATYAGAWTVAPSILVFPKALFGVLNIDEWVWFFFWAAFIVAFYERFLDGPGTFRVSRHAWFGIAAGTIATASVLLAFFFAPSLLDIRFAYLIVGTAAVAPAAVEIAFHPKLTKKLLLLIPFFFCTYLAFELIALKVGWWSFDGQYIGVLSFWGMRLALEELVIWILLGSAVVAAYHEFLIDDGK